MNVENQGKGTIAKEKMVNISMKIPEVQYQSLLESYEEQRETGIEFKGEYIGAVYQEVSKLAKAQMEQLDEPEIPKNKLSFYEKYVKRNNIVIILGGLCFLLFSGCIYLLGKREF